MSHSDVDSDGFESAEEENFNETTSTAKPEIESTSEKLETNTKQKETLDRFKVLDLKGEGKEDENDDWGWGDEDDDNFIFDSKQKSKIKTENVPKLIEPQIQLDRPTSSEVITQQQQQQQLQNASAWSPWSGMVSFISTASTGVASFTSHVSSVIESNIGIPDPEKFAQQQREEQSPNDSLAEKVCDEPEVSTEAKQQQNDEKLLNLGSFVSNVTSISNRVISGGLDTLEGIGKKTMTILQENDAGLISKRKLLGLDNLKPVLSQVLREAKEKSEESEKTMKLTQKQMYRKQLHFETLFDDYHGLVHLEALEMLSKQASMKLQALLMPLSGNALNELQQTMNSVSELCELGELDQDDYPNQLYDVSELEEKFKTATEDFDISIDFSDILK